MVNDFDSFLGLGALRAVIVVSLELFFSLSLEKVTIIQNFLHL